MNMRLRSTRSGFAKNLPSAQRIITPSYLYVKKTSPGDKINISVSTKTDLTEYTIYTNYSCSRQGKTLVINHKISDNQYYYPNFSRIKHQLKGAYTESISIGPEFTNLLYWLLNFIYELQVMDQRATEHTDVYHRRITYLYRRYPI